MTLLEKVQELQSIKPPLSQEDFNSKLNAYKASQPKEELKEDAKVDSKETKDKPESNTETEGKTNDSANADQGVESEKNTKSESESGDLQPSEKNDSVHTEQVLSDAEQRASIDPEYTTVAAPGQTYVRDGDPTEYKYDASGQYYFRQKGSEDWQQGVPPNRIPSRYWDYL